MPSETRRILCGSRSSAADREADSVRYADSAAPNLVCLDKDLARISSASRGASPLRFPCRLVIRESAALVRLIYKLLNSSLDLRVAVLDRRDALSTRVLIRVPLMPRIAAECRGGN